MPIIESAPGAPEAPSRARPGAEGPGLGAVTFRMFASGRAAAGAGEVHVAPGPAAEAVAALTAAMPPRFADVMAASSLVADGIRLDPASSAPIPGGTIVDVLPPFAGG